jgi:sugar phosphate isomerase/epimerase
LAAGNVKPMKFPLTGFADEISPDLRTQVEVCKRLGLTGLDLRSVDGINVLDLSLEQIEAVADLCRENGLVVQAIGSPVNKIDYDIMLQGREHERLRKAIKAASVTNCKRVRLFTPAVPDDQHDAMAGTIIDWMLDQRRLAEEFGVTLIHENDGKYWGAYPENAKRLFAAVGNDNFKAAFDFANTVLLGFRPMQDWFPWLLPHLDTLHIKDAKDGKVVPAGEGDGQIAETMRWLIEQGWHGPLTMEPHLSAAGPFGGFSGEQLFEAAVVAFRNELAKAGGEA